VPQKKSHNAALNAKIETCVPPAERSGLQDLIELYAEQRVQRAVLSAGPTVAPPPPGMRTYNVGTYHMVAQAPPPGNHGHMPPIMMARAPLPMPPVKRQRLASLDLKAQRDKFKKNSSTSMEQLEVLLEIEALLNGDLQQLNTGDRRFYRRAAVGLVCFRACCNSDKELFVANYPSKIPCTNFKCFLGKEHGFSTSYDK